MNMLAMESKKQSDSFQIQILEPENRIEREEAIRYCQNNNWPSTTKIELSKLIALDAMNMLEESKEPYLKLSMMDHPDKFFFVHFWVARFHLDRVELTARYLARGINK
ncbi:hypothetical protein ND856_14035 [Leptospira bandrabouensis]|uniref:hypothetical protein n=1 Tax=Leptospira bandrabouensis TaxID=2484903 RepID=UPI00223E425A|nr:hypothetical protein [Leptospira bandrabouensis]MCW7459572.1 hypothetical protein [Leptospira bandrabouensis]MCW7478410.1 hypothetical protein [Leptospira bandrabouensis]MCW7486307.1 hypothetical protein [Leptospira bandrabouensis]